MTVRKKKSVKSIAKGNVKSYTPTEKERYAAAQLIERREQSSPLPRFKVETDGQSSRIGYDHEDPTIGAVLFMNALNIEHSSLGDCLISQLASVAGEGKAVTAVQLESITALVAAITPRDSTEAILACQMAAVHNATMTAARRLSSVELISQQDSASNMLNKLARTFAAQVETLKKYRSTGEQNIKVQHVTVNEGGQAIVGNVAHGGGVNEKNDRQAHAKGELPATSVDPMPQMRCQDPERERMPLTSSDRQDAMPNARRSQRKRRSNG